MRIVAPEGTRELPLDEFLRRSARQRARARRDALGRGRRSSRAEDARAIFLKKGRVRMDIALASVAVLLEIDGQQLHRGAGRRRLGRPLPHAPHARPRPLLDGQHARRRDHCASARGRRARRSPDQRRARGRRLSATPGRARCVERAIRTLMTGARLMSVTLSFEVNGEPARLSVEPHRAADRRAARPAGPDRHQGRLRRRRVRRLHGAGRRPPGHLLPVSRPRGRGPQGHHHRGPGRTRRRALAAAAGLRRQGRQSSAASARPAWS